MSGGKQTRGYTIVEVLIVLAVSSFMFLIAANFISGKQAKSAFNSGVNDFAAQVQQIRDSVYAGHYTDLPINCQATVAGLNISGIGSTGQGTNKDCVFLGKVVHLASDHDRSHFETFSIIGRRTKYLTGDPITTLADASPTAVYNPAGSVDFTTHSITPQSLDIQKVTLVNIDGSPVAADTVYDFGFVQNVGSASGGAGSNYESGGENLLLVYVPSITSSTDTATAASKIRLLGLKNARSAVVCLTDGTRYATVSIGTSTYSRLNVTRKLGLTSC